MTTFEVFLLL